MEDLSDSLPMKAMKKQREEEHDDELHKFMNLGVSFAFIPAHAIVIPVEVGSDQERPEKMIKKFEDETQLGFRHLSSLIKATDSALILENERIQRCKYCKMMDEKKHPLGNFGNECFLNMVMFQQIQQIMRTKPSLILKGKATELIDVLNKSPCPTFITNSLFAKKFLSACVERMNFYSGLAFIYAQLIVLVSSQVPHVMDFLLAELNRVCIYTVPKHIEYSETEFESKEAYYKAIGYKEEEDGKIESHESYLARLGNYMRLYGALVQTDRVDGVENSHGSRVGWGWLVRFLTGLPPNVYTLAALEGFLSMARFDLYFEYKVHFTRLSDFVSMKFLDGLKEMEKLDQKMVRDLRRIQDYIEAEEFLREPDAVGKRIFTRSRVYKT